MFNPIEMRKYEKGDVVEVTGDDFLVYNNYFHVCYYSEVYGGFFEVETDSRIHNALAYRPLTQRPEIKEL